MSKLCDATCLAYAKDVYAHLRTQTHISALCRVRAPACVRLDNRPASDIGT
jgi:hypothetical protein